MASVRLFVYGSLKRAGRHHDELDGALFLGEAETLPGYRLEPLGEYLALVPPEPKPAAAQPLAEAKPEHETDPETAQAEAQPEHETAVSGEVFEVDESKLSALDAFEGDAYERGNVRLKGEHSQKPGFALAYFKKAR
jgi:gamma-glutamylcyclotransferase (GGCT)/AIG2-like uncharacterized protein YtfP